MPETNAITYSKLTIDGVAWTALVTPIACNYVVIDNASGATTLKFRTQDDDANTERSIAIGTARQIAFPYYRPLKPAERGPAFRFSAGDTVGYLQDASGARTVDLEFIL